MTEMLSDAHFKLYKKLISFNFCAENTLWADTIGIDRRDVDIYIYVGII